MSNRFRFAAVSAVLLLTMLHSPTSAEAQSNPPGFGVGPIHKGLAGGVVVGAAAVVGVGITFLVLHNRGVLTGCITESGGKKTLVSSGELYSLVETGSSLPIGDRAKLKGHKQGPASAPSFQVNKVLKDYGHCQR